MRSNKWFILCAFGILGLLGFGRRIDAQDRPRPNWTVIPVVIPADDGGERGDGLLRIGFKNVSSSALLLCVSDWFFDVRHPQHRMGRLGNGRAPTCVTRQAFDPVLPGETFFIQVRYEARDIQFDDAVIDLNVKVFDWAFQRGALPTETRLTWSGTVGKAFEAGRSLLH